MLDGLLCAVARLAIGIVACLSLRSAAILGRVCGGIVYLLDGRHRRMARSNLSLCFPELAPSEVVRLARENFMRIGENICCAIRSLSMDETAIGKLFDVRQSASIQSNAGFKARNVVLASGHFGSFELFSRLAPHFRQFRHAATYRGIRQRRLDALLLKLRSKCGLLLFERRAGAEALKNELNAGGVMAIFLSDQSDRHNGLELPFFGRPAFTNRAPAVLAARYQSALFVPICYRLDLGSYRIEMGEPIPTRNASGERRSCEAITRDINSAFEAAIRRDPANWFWVHNRWKQKPRAAF